MDIDALGRLLDARLTPATREPRVVLSGNHAIPWVLLGAVDAHLPRYRLHALNAPPGMPDREGVLYETAFVGAGMRRHPRLRYYPSRLSHVPRLFGDRLPVDLVLVNTSLPVGGKISLGVEVNVLPAVIEAAKSAGAPVIAQANRQMPYTFGDGEFDVDVFDGIVEVDFPLGPLGGPATPVPSPNPEVPAAGRMERADSARIIGDFVSSRIADGATLQMGIGEIPDAALAGLLQRRGLRVWTEMLSDGILALHRAGALDPDRELTTSFVLGSPDLYHWVHRNERVRVLRTETTNSPTNISRNVGMTSINTALQVDLLDQANASRIDSRIYSGFGGQTDFTVGAMHARGGQALMALRSWHPKAGTSTIVPLLDEPVTSFQHTAVITEHGVAEIVGRDEREQAANLILQAADPRVRDELWEEAYHLGLA